MTAMELSAHRMIFAALAMLSPLVAGCMPDTPRTVFDWGVNDQMPRHVARSDARLYAYRDEAAPKPVPSYVTTDVAPYRPPVQTSSYSRASLPAPVYGDSDAVVFAWPVNGKVISDFGAADNGGRNDGINIATAMRAPIRAAASGTVSYSGNELKNYGNLLLIKHAGGYVTAYAHADRLLVGRGDSVAKGQIIGYAGETGDVTSPQLHFEIRRDTTPINPRPLLMVSARNS
jgi:murein DD-endopeptidase MepM/ murein hydrolase activator NlpD